ncbi:MAG: mitochondrial carrier protein [Monoraphidium minutum]|nr:MAG: mitochondrial carrier protein [Monoraphidium minutum]
MEQQQQQQVAQFQLNAAGGSLVLRGSRKAGLAFAGPADRSGSLALPGSVSFTTRAAGGVTKRMLVARPARGMPVGRGAPLPLASLSVALPFASISLGKKAKVEEAPKKKKRSAKDVFDAACKSALRGGLPGAAAMAIQVLSLMWLRTTVNYEYRYGGGMMNALKVLYSEGGVRRFYQGLAPALIQGPLSRFGDTAANTAVLAVLEDVDMPVAAKTVAASMAAGLFRIFLMPVDALKTIMQVEGASGVASLGAKVAKGGPTVLYHGALAASAATFVGHYPWFATYNSLDAYLPKPDANTHQAMKFLRSAFMGFCASLVSDTCSNSIRVVKTAKQTVTTPMSYAEVVKMIVEKDGLGGLFGRGLRTKIIANAIQGVMFSVLWRMGQDMLAKKEKDQKDAADAAAKASKKK